MSKKKQPSEKAYSAENIVKLEPREHIRRRPGMYVGGTGKRALHHLIYEVLDNSAESAFVGKCDTITVHLQPNNYVTILDNDRLLSSWVLKSSWDDRLNMHPLDVIMTQVGWNKFDEETYGATGGLHGLGLSVVNILSAHMEVKVCRNNQVWKRSYSAGIPVGALQTFHSTTPIEDGMTFRFQPDFTIFDKNDFDYGRVAKRCEDIVDNTPNLTIHLIDEQTNPEQRETFNATDGVKSLVKKLNTNKTPLHDILHLSDEIEATVRGTTKKFYVEIALQYTDSDEMVEHSYVNTVANIQGGVHISGLHAGISGIINNDFQFMYDPPRFLNWQQISRGLTVVISIRHPDPQFQSPTKTHLMNPEIFGGVANLVYMNLSHDLIWQLRDHFRAMFESLDT